MNTHSYFYRSVALTVSGIMFLNPVVSAATPVLQASVAPLVVDARAGSNTQIGQAANGVPLVNIATPGAKGLSHNKFQSYNVDKQGLILNNSRASQVNSQLGGQISANPNLTGDAAKVILNEVTGSSPSQLKGATEVAGQAAHVIVANPHGITCDGCGFINTPRATLTTGAPVVEDGQLSRYNVEGGAISIEGEGLNAGNIDQFELITRSAKINAKVQAKDLSVIAGRNDVDADTLVATPKPGDGSDKPQLAIDSSALGGMYANTIRLVGTESGVGVKLAGDVAASGGDLLINVNGRLELTEGSRVQHAGGGTGALVAEQLVNSGTLTSDGTLVLITEHDITNRNQISANQLGLNAGGNLENLSGQITATQELAINVDGQLTHRTETGGQRAQIRVTGSPEGTPAGPLALRAGNATITNADVIAAGSLYADIQDKFEVLASFDTTKTTTTTATQVKANVAHFPVTIKGTLTTTQYLTNVGSSILQAGGALYLGAVGNLTVQAARLIAGAALTLDAGGNLNLAAAKEERRSESTAKQSVGGSTFDSTSTTTTNDVIHHVNTLQAGGDLKLLAGENLLVQGGTATAGGSVTLAADAETGTTVGNIDIVALVDSRTVDSRNETKKLLELFGSRQVELTSASSTNQTVQGFTAQAGGHLGVWGAGDVVMTDVSLASQGDMMLIGERNLSVQAAQARSGSQQEIKAYDSDDYNRLIKGSAITNSALQYLYWYGNGGVPVPKEHSSDSHERITVYGNTLTSGGVLTALTGANLMLLATQTQSESVDLVAGNTAFIGGVQGSSTDQHFKTGIITLMDRQSAHTATTETEWSQDWISSALKATHGGITIRAGGIASGLDPDEGLLGAVQLPNDGSIALMGSTLDASGDILLQADGGLVIATGEQNRKKTGESRNTDDARSNPKPIEFNYRDPVPSAVLSGGNLEALAGHDIAVAASRLSADNDLILSAGGRIDASADVKRAETPSDNAIKLWASPLMISTGERRIADTLVGVVLSAGGKGSLQSGVGTPAVVDSDDAVHDASRDIVLNGAQLEGGSFDVIAGGNLDMGTVQLNYFGDISSKDTLRTFTNVVTTLNTESDLTLKAGNDILGFGSEAHAQAGNVFISAGRDINIDSTNDYNESVHETSRKTTTIIKTPVIGFKESSGAEGSIVIQAGRDITLESVDLQGGTGGLRVQAGRDLNLSVGMVGYTQTSHSEDDYVVWAKSHDKGSVSSTAQDNQFSATGPMSFSAGRDAKVSYGGGTALEIALYGKEKMLERFRQNNPWLAYLTAQGKITYDPKTKIVDSWDKHQHGLSQFGGIVLTVIVTILTCGTGSGGVGGAIMSVGESEAIAVGAAEAALQAGTAAAFTAAEAATATATMDAAVATVINGALKSMATSMLMQLATTGKIDVRQTLISTATSAMSLGVAEYFGKTYSLSRLLADTAVGCAGSALNGGSCKNGAINGFAMNGLAWAGDAMRTAMIEQSQAFGGIMEVGENGRITNFYSNASGPAPYDELKLGGVRLNVQKICEYGTCESILQENGTYMVLYRPGSMSLEDAVAKTSSTWFFGGTQGGDGVLFGLLYGPDSWQHKLVELYGGKHDFLNGVIWGGYETQNVPEALRFVGNAAVVSGLHSGFLEVMNFIDVALATPFALSWGLYDNNMQWLVISNPKLNGHDD